MAINYAVEYPLLQRRLADYGKQVHHWKSRCEELEAKLDATHNWVLNTCPEEYNQFVKALEGDKP